MSLEDQIPPPLSQLGSTLAAATAVISDFQEVCFTQYIRLVLPLDGYVFWVKADLISPSAMFGGSPFNAAALDSSPEVAVAAPTLTVRGSFHVSVEQRQAEDETLAVNRVIFTTNAPIQQIEASGPQVLWIASYKPPGMSNSIRFAFSATRHFYDNAALWHYMGDAIYPALESQLVDNPAAFDTKDIVVSNSLPVWLGMPNYVKPYDDGIYPPDFPFYPSFLIPDDAEPPYASVHIEPGMTRALQAIPAIDPLDNHTQLVTDHVRLTFYGLRNYNALDFQDFLTEYSRDVSLIGIMSMPVIRDEKRTQAELGVIAMRKTFEVDISYIQARVRNFALKQIKSVVTNYSWQGVYPPTPVPPVPPTPPSPYPPVPPRPPTPPPPDKSSWTTGYVTFRVTNQEVIYVASGTTSVVLPPTPPPNRSVQVKDETGNQPPGFTVSTSDFSQIEGEPTFAFEVQGEAVEFRWNGKTGWSVF